jgi:hypothetical protein
MNIFRIIALIIISIVAALPSLGKSLKSGVDVAMYNLTFCLNTYYANHGSVPNSLEEIVNDDKYTSLIKAIKSADGQGRDLHYLFPSNLAVRVGSKNKIIAVIAYDFSSGIEYEPDDRIPAILYDQKRNVFSQIRIPMQILTKAFPAGALNTFLSKGDQKNKFILPHNKKSPTKSPIENQKSVYRPVYPDKTITTNDDKSKRNDGNPLYTYIPTISIILVFIIVFWIYFKIIQKKKAS